ncbi:MAG TPA: ATP-dependent Clp protease adaptor ClpS [Fimbriimonadaceae bacterium]|nr:ATP-dependent Clp protease adaptor ClpS [Fimbriimonadaceae bacterium]
MSQTAVDPKVDGPGIETGRWMVVIYNNDVTPFDMVIIVLMRATGCGAREAEIEAWEAHTFGKAPVHFSSKEECEKAAVIISSIGVKTEVCPEWND